MKRDGDGIINWLEFLIQAEREIDALKVKEDYELYELLHHLAGRIVSTEVFAVCLFCSTSEKLFCTYNFDGRRYNEPATLPLGEGPVSHVVRNRQAFVLSREPGESGFPSDAAGDAAESGCPWLSAVYVPMRARDAEGHERLLGVVSVQSSSADAYSKEAVCVLQWLADRAAAQLQQERTAALWRFRLQAAEAQAPHLQHHAIAMVARFAEILKNLTQQVETLHDLLSHLPASHRAALLPTVHALRRQCYRSQTEANLLPLRYHHIVDALEPDAGKSAPPLNPLEILTEREREILEQLASGASNPAIARQLHVSVDTVKFHCKNIYEKLGVRNRTQAVQFLTGTSPSTTETHLSGR